MNVVGKISGQYNDLALPCKKFDNNGVYQCTITINKEDAVPVREILKQKLEEAMAKPHTVERQFLCWKEGIGGTMDLSLKMKVLSRRIKGEKQFKRTLPLMDSEGELHINPEPGSLVEIDATFEAWSGRYGFGVSATMNKVMVLTLIGGDTGEPMEE